jgi:hypothetical protein
MCVIISLTAQGTAIFFNSDAAPSTVRSSLGILKASLVLLLFANLSFLGILTMFYRRCSTTKVFNDGGYKKIKVLTIVLYATGLLILVRNIFRTVQIFSSPYSSVWETETFFWVFDAAPLLISSLLLNAFHPAKLVPVSVGCTH